jgi:cell division protein FtsL
MKRTFTVMAMVIALALSAMSVAFAASANQKATSDGVEFTTATGGAAFVSFGAHTVQGKGNNPAVTGGSYVYKDLATDIEYTGTVECLVVAGNKAVFAGSADGDRDFFRIIVEDNASGDKITVNERNTSAYDCDINLTANQLVTSGDLKVHNRS